MTNLKKHIIVVFLGIFILIKVSPAYYGDQVISLLSIGNSKLATTSVRVPLAEKFLIGIDKAIIESDTFKTVSIIKFSGLALALLFLSTCSFFGESLKKTPLLNYSFCETRRYLSQRVLRL